MSAPAPPAPPAPPARKKYTLAEVFGEDDDDQDEDNAEDAAAAAAAGVGGARQDFGRPAAPGKLMPLRVYTGWIKKIALESVIVLVYARHHG